jgi:hypothetical protein
MTQDQASREFVQMTLSEWKRLTKSAAMLQAGRIGLWVGHEDVSQEAAKEQLARAAECLCLARDELSR